MHGILSHTPCFKTLQQVHTVLELLSINGATHYISAPPSSHYQLCCTLLGICVYVVSRVVVNMLYHAACLLQSYKNFFLIKWQKSDMSTANEDLPAGVEGTTAGVLPKVSPITTHEDIDHTFPVLSSG